MKTETQKPASTRDDFTEQIVGYMLEGSYKWNEYCEEHGASHMLIYPDRKARTITTWETGHALRPYVCWSCGRTIGAGQ